MLVEAEIWTVARTDQGNAVLVRPLGAEVAVPIFIGQLETQSILIGMGNVPMPRPLTHDLFLSLLKQLEVELERIEISSLKEGTFFAKLVLSHDESTLHIDARPSDAMGIAVRHKCPIFIEESVVDEAGIPLSSISEQPIETELNPAHKEKEELEKQLEAAVAEENYEEAARIRDKLQELEDNS
ncbi:MAG TPA: hypothetical protein ENN41_10095 [Sediminispirochaeta sp.]|nr:hypothetical protein [Sediminispirochaeta sp.]